MADGDNRTLKRIDLAEDGLTATLVTNLLKPNKQPSLIRDQFVGYSAGGAAFIPPNPGPSNPLGLHHVFLPVFSYNNIHYANIIHYFRRDLLGRIHEHGTLLGKFLSKKRTEDNPFRI